MKRSVTLHVYALSETGGAKFISRLGLGLWHSGLEVGGKEYFFSGGKASPQSFVYSFFLSVVTAIARLERGRAEVRGV